jgi:hypothetical protein
MGSVAGGYGILMLSRGKFEVFGDSWGVKVLEVSSRGITSGCESKE